MKDPLITNDLLFNTNSYSKKSEFYSETSKGHF